MVLVPRKLIMHLFLVFKKSTISFTKTTIPQTNESRHKYLKYTDKYNHFLKSRAFSQYSTIVNYLPFFICGMLNNVFFFRFKSKHRKKKFYVMIFPI